MYERCLTEAERVLASSRQVAVPIKEVWEKVSKLSRAVGFESASLPDFTAMLEADKRFEILPSQKSPEDIQPELFSDDDPDESELERLGFYGEDRVKLKRIIVRPPEDDDEEPPISVKGLSVSKPADKAKKVKPAKAKQQKKIKKTPKSKTRTSGKKNLAKSAARKLKR